MDWKVKWAEYGPKGRMNIFFTAAHALPQDREDPSWRRAISLGWERDREVTESEVYGRPS